MKVPGLNLLPQQEKEELELHEILGRWQPSVYLLLMIGVVAFAGLFAARWVLDQRAKTLTQNIQTKIQLNSRQGALDIGQATVRVNEQARLLSQSLSGDMRWSEALTQILSVLPNDISVASLEITMSGSVSLKGVAKTRSSFLALDTALKGATFLTQVQTSDTASKREQLPFTYTATYRQNP